MFTEYRPPAQTPDYLADITAALISHGRTESQARATSRIFVPSLRLTPELQVDDFVKMEKAVAAAGREEDFMVLNFARPSKT
jgi:hypothetical protein